MNIYQVWADVDYEGSSLIGTWYVLPSAKAVLCWLEDHKKREPNPADVRDYANPTPDEEAGMRQYSDSYQAWRDELRAVFGQLSCYGDRFRLETVEVLTLPPEAIRNRLEAES